MSISRPESPYIISYGLDKAIWNKNGSKPSLSNTAVTSWNSVQTLVVCPSTTTLYNEAYCLNFQESQLIVVKFFYNVLERNKNQYLGRELKDSIVNFVGNSI